MNTIKMEDILKPRIILSSKEAKDHLGKARIFYDEMSNGIEIQKQNVERQRMESMNAQQEQNRFNDMNIHDQNMERLKLSKRTHA